MRFKVGDPVYFNSDLNKPYLSSGAPEHAPFDTGPGEVADVDTNIHTHLPYLVERNGEYSWVYDGSLSAVSSAVRNYHISIASGSVDILCDKVGPDKARRILDILLEEDGGV